MTRRNHPKTESARPKAIDLFCGAGGMSLGFEQAGFDIVLGVDRDPYHCAAHERNFPYGKTVCESVINLTAADIRRMCETDGDIDLVFGGPPCQGFSTMGKRDIGDPRNSLVGEFIRIVKEIRPKAFVMENVPGMQQGSTKTYFDFVIEALTAAGYNITLPARTLLATDFGAPQKRQRLFVIGIRKDQPRTARYPIGVPADQPVARNVGEAFQGLPLVDGNESLYREDSLAHKARKKDVVAPYARVLSGMYEDPTDFSYPRSVRSGLVFGNKLTRHSPASIALYEATAPGSMVPGHKLPRLDPRGFSPTLRAGTESERGSHTAPRPIHPQFPRCITVREAARLHGYPDWFAFYPVIHHGFRQVGNSVSPLVARAVGRSVVAALALNSGDIKPHTVIELSDDFVLPASEKKSEKRISHIDEFPKVINHLFASRYNKRSGTLDTSIIAFEEIAAAIHASGANMPRIRPESFFSEFSKGRNARKIMDVPFRAGYSLVSVDGGIQFVEKDTLGSIGASRYFGFNSSDVNGHEAISLLNSLKTDLERILGVLKKSRLVGSVSADRDLLGDLSGERQRIWIDTETKKQRAVMWHTKRAHSVPLDAVEKMMLSEKVDAGVAGVSLTDRHIGILVFKRKSKTVKLIEKRVFLLTA